VVVTVQVFEPLPGYVGINLGCRQVAVPEQHLHHPQVGAMIDQVGGEGMA
jgi:hypothetical protein